jgi:thiol-disulfide isomerase/thioredoxin
VAKKKAEKPEEPQPQAQAQQPPPWTYPAYGAFVVLAAVLVYSFVTVAREGEARRECSALCLMRPNYAGANLTAPDFKLKDLNGQDVSLSSYRGKVVLLNFWASWCAPCREEMPDLGELAHILKPEKDVAMVTVSVDNGPDEVRDLLKTVLREDPPPFPVLFDPQGDHIVGAKYGTHQFPETWLIDKRGVIRARFDGSRPWSNPVVVEMIEQLRGSDYCPVEIKEGATTGKAAHFCEDPTGS